MSSRPTPWRYPGSKRRLLKHLSPEFDARAWETEWVEPFVGGGGFLPSLPPATRLLVLNDLDLRVASWWDVVADEDDGDYNSLLDMLRETTPTVELHRELQGISMTAKRLDLAYAGIMLNRMSFSGILDATAIGGPKQQSKWGVGCRFKLADLIPQHDNARRRVLGAFVTSVDFAQVLADNEGFAVCDPPYVEKSHELYGTTPFGESDHRRLAECLLGRGGHWLLTYDDHPLVRELYESATIREVPVRYSIRGAEGWSTKTELIVTP